MMFAISTKHTFTIVWPMRRHLIHSVLPPTSSLDSSSSSSSPLSPLVSHSFVSSSVSSSFSSSVSSPPLFPPLPLPELVTELYPRRPQVVEQKVLPLLWCVLGQTSGGMHQANTSLCQALLDQMGPGLVQSAASQSPNVRRDLNKLLRTMA